MPNPLGQLGRRTFLLLATAAAAAVGRRAPAWTADPLPGAGMAFAFKHPDSAIAVGRRYLSAYPDAAGARALAEDLRRSGAGDPAAARLALRERVREDFERGDTVLVDGWVLARSECRACAAVALAAAS